MCNNVQKYACRRRAQLENTLTDSCTVTRLGSVIDRFGSEAQAQTIIATYPCRVNVSSKPNNVTLGNEDVVRADWEIMLPIDAEVTNLNTLTVGDAQFTVLDTDAGRTGALLLTARCRKDV